MYWTIYKRTQHEGLSRGVVSVSRCGVRSSMTETSFLKPKVGNNGPNIGDTKWYIHVSGSMRDDCWKCRRHRPRSANGTLPSTYIHTCAQSALSYGMVDVADGPMYVHYGANGWCLSCDTRTTAISAVGQISFFVNLNLGAADSRFKCAHSCFPEWHSTARRLCSSHPLILRA